MSAAVIWAVVAGAGQIWGDALPMACTFWAGALILVAGIAFALLTRSRPPKTTQTPGSHPSIPGH